ncbi:MAG: aminoacyl-tRNA hydrolase [Pseudomonadota bacterium]
MSVGSYRVYLIAGLGNPGKAYKNTRHNMGFRVIDHWAGSLGVQLSNRRFQSRNARASYRENGLILVRPMTYMNLSGQSIRAIADYYHIKTEDILVVHDDLDLPLGKIRVARNGGAGGHKGILSIVQCLGTKEFFRVKVGVGRPRHGEAVDDYVLSPFYSDEKEILEGVINLAAGACELFVSEGIEAAMNHINSKNLAKKEGTI